jgi:hypothetical protein
MKKTTKGKSKLLLTVEKVRDLSPASESDLRRVNGGMMTADTSIGSCSATHVPPTTIILTK